MTPYQEWLIIRASHPTRSLNACLVFVPTMKTLPPPTPPKNLHSALSFCSPAVAIQATAQVAAGREALPRTLAAHNSNVWTSVATQEVDIFQEKLRIILGTTAPAESDAVAVLKCLCLDQGQPFTKAGLTAALRPIGFDEDLTCTAARLWGYVNNTNPTPLPRITTRPRLSQLYVVALWLKDRNHEMKSVRRDYTNVWVAKSEENTHH